MDTSGGGVGTTARPPPPPPARTACLGLAGLLVVPCLGLVWPGPVLPALPATTTAAAQPPPAAEGCRLLLLDQAKARQARQARQAQARPSQGKAQQASQPEKSGSWLASEKSGPRLPSEQPAAASAARARRSQTGAAKAPAGAIAAAATFAAATTIDAAGCSDGNLGPEFSNGGLCVRADGQLGGREARTKV